MRPNTPRMEQITLRIPVRTLAELEREARDAGRSRSEYMRDVIVPREDASADAPDPERVRDLERQLADCQRDLERTRDHMDVLTDAYQSKKQEANALEVYKERADRGFVGRVKGVLFGRDD